MENDHKPTLAAQKRAFRLWFEYLQVARKSTKREVKDSLSLFAPYYGPWEMGKATKFDPWWKEHSHLFEEKHFVREISPGELPRDPDALLIEVPLTQSPTLLTKAVKALIQAAFEKQEKKNRKAKKRPTAHYRLTEGTEPKFDALREMLSIYRDVYLKNPKLRGEQLLEATHAYYLGRKSKRWAKVPSQFLHQGADDKIRAMRNLRRYIQKAERVVLNVAMGQFPGNY